MSKRILFALVLCAYFAFGFHHLADFISADEHFWLPNSGSERIKDYWKAIEKGDWEKTRINDKPGITLAYTSGIALLFDNGKGQIAESDGTYKRFDPERTVRINLLYRLPILILSGLFSLYFYWILKKITKDEWAALWAVTGMLLSPILLGMSQIVNPDSLFWIFGAATLFSFYAFLQEGERKLAVLASLFLGLGLASKYVTIIFLPFFFAATLGYYFFEFETWRGRQAEFGKMVLKNSLTYLAIIAGGFLIFALMMPASFVQPEFFYLGTVGFPGMAPIFWAVMALNLVLIIDARFFSAKGLAYVLAKLYPLRNVIARTIYSLLSLMAVFIIINWLTRNSIIDLSGVPFNLKRSNDFSELPYYSRFIMEFVPLIFSLTPIALLALIFVWVKGVFSRLRLNTFVFILSAFFIVFYVAVIEQGLLVTVRYSIILFPFALTLGAIALREFFSENSERSDKRALMVYTAILSAVSVFFLLSQVQQAYYDSGSLKKIFVSRVFQSPLPIIGIIAIIAFLTWAIYRFFPWKKLAAVSGVWIFGGLMALNILSLSLISPYYFSYTNDLLPKYYIISGAWGYGGFEAAQYLNAMPEAKELTVWADSYGFCEFFVGKCIHKEKVDVTQYPIDYYFESLQSTLAMRFPHPMEKHSSWSTLIDDRPKSFVKLTKALK